MSAQSIARLDAAQIRNASGKELNVQVLKETGSTNQDALESSLESPLLIAAEFQNHGRGKPGRSFCSEEGGLYFSLMVRHLRDFDPGLLCTAAAVCCVEALESLYDLPVQIKWVNDIMLDGRKAGGILCEARWRGNMLERVVIGIGLNVFQTSFPQQLAASACSLQPCCAKHIDRSVLAGEIAGRLLALLESTADARSLLYEKAWSYSCLKNCMVSIESAETVVQGTVTGLSADGGLCIAEKESGSPLCFSWGEVTKTRLLSVD